MTASAHAVLGADAPALPLSSVPGPRGLPLIGNLAALAGGPLAFMSGLARDHGDLARFSVAGQQTLLVSAPALIEQVLVQHRKLTVKDPITAQLSDVLGNGLLTAEGETWRRNRKLVAPSFQPVHLAALGDTMVRSTVQLSDQLSDGPQDVHPEMMALTLDIAVRTLFGTVLDDAGRVGPLVEALMTDFDQKMHTWRRLLPAWLPTAEARRAARTRDELHGILMKLVQQRRAQGSDGNDLLARLLSARDEDGAGMDDEQLKDEMLTLFLAGHETTALSLGYALWLLSRHPDVQQQVQAELAAVIGDRDPVAADSRKLPVTTAVFQEAMRMYPPAWVIGRQVTQDLVLAGAPMGDVAVPAGTVLLMPQWVVHRDPRWFDAPLQFRPSRWLEPNQRPRFSFFPFGGGPRVCVGNHFAQMEAVLVLATLLQRFEILPVDLEGGDSQTPELLASVTLRPAHGIQVDLRQRGPGRVVVSQASSI